MSGAVHDGHIRTKIVFYVFPPKFRGRFLASLLPLQTMDKRRNKGKGRPAAARGSRCNRFWGWLLFGCLAVACIVAYDRTLHGRLTVLESGRREMRRLEQRWERLGGTAGQSRTASETASGAAGRRLKTGGGDNTASGRGKPAAGARPAGGAALERPAVGVDDLILRHGEGRYTLCYDSLYRQASWVAYVLTRIDVETVEAERGNRFVPDPLVVAEGYPTAETDDYRNSGYDRGHLCPSADRRGSQRENDCTFYLSNIAPQTPALNRGAWRRLEEQVRRWAERYDTLYVVTGSIMDYAPDTLRGGVGIPDYFYKALLASDGEGGYRAAAFVLPNATHITGDYADYAVTVDSLESWTGMDFFCRLPDTLETAAEQVFVSDFWR